MPSTSLLEAAFAHHVWATIRPIDTCEDLSPQHRQHMVPGTRGPIIETLAHIVDSDTWDLAILEQRILRDVEDTGLDAGPLGEAMQRNGTRRAALLMRPLGTWWLPRSTGLESTSRLP